MVRNEEFHLVYERSTSCIRGIILRTTFSSDKVDQNTRARTLVKMKMEDKGHWLLTKKKEEVKVVGVG